MSDLIAAIATGSIATAIGIVRVSGDGCFAACDRVFRPRNGVPFAQQTSHKMVFGEMLDDSGAVIDQGLAVRFGGGHSYTGEDSAEFHCHGSPVVLHTLLSALFAAGARQAQAGEFTKRAFLNGKMDLTEAEAVIDLIDAQSAAAAKNAAAQLDGGLRRRLEPVQEALIDILPVLRRGGLPRRGHRGHSAAADPILSANRRRHPLRPAGHRPAGPGAEKRRPHRYRGPAQCR